MADVADQAQRLEETARDAALRARKPADPPATGSCLHCGEPDIEGLFCDQDCRDDYVRLQAKRHNDAIVRGVV